MKKTIHTLREWEDAIQKELKNLGKPFSIQVIKFGLDKVKEEHGEEDRDKIIKKYNLEKILNGKEI